MISQRLAGLLQHIDQRLGPVFVSARLARRVQQALGAQPVQPERSVDRERMPAGADPEPPGAQRPDVVRKRDPAGLGRLPPRPEGPALPERDQGPEQEQLDHEGQNVRVEHRCRRRRAAGRAALELADKDGRVLTRELRCGLTEKAIQER